MNEALEALAQALFKSWFVDFDPVIDKALKVGNEIPEPLQKKAQQRQQVPNEKKLIHTNPELVEGFPDKFTFTGEMGWIPEGWYASNFGEQFKITMGQSPPGSSYNEIGKGVKFFQSKADFRFRYPSDRIWTEEPKRFAEKGDTLMSVRAPVGSINIAIDNCCIGIGLAAIMHTSTSISYTYYNMKFKELEFQSYEANGTVFGSINQKELKSLGVVKPPAEVINSFDFLASCWDDKILANTEEIGTLKSIRNTLLPKLILGELRVPEAEQLVADHV